MSTLNPLLGFAAGALTILSPCVLPLVPIVLNSALQKSKWGPLVLSAGLVLSFTVVGFLIAAVGVSSGFDASIVAQFGAILLVTVGLVLLVPAAQNALTKLASPLANWASQKQQGLERFGLFGQAMIGVLLGLIWSPCVGPTLGAATVLAAEGKDLVSAATVMFAFGLGIASVLLALAFATRTLLSRWRGTMMSAGGRGKAVLGGILVAVGVMVLTGADKYIEGTLVQMSPDWLIDLTVSA